MEMSGEIKLDSLVETYLAIRNERDKLSREHDAKDKELSNDLAQIEQVLLNSCNEVGADSIRTGAGTVIKSTKENFVCGDWDNFKQYVMQHDAIELLQQRIHQTNFKEFLSGREDEGLPPGISSMREFRVTVRKPSNK
jgi:hypothetical protein|tara:strand:- start:347 stop:760 length:414 start_codon:yes stop_codon:yes gene_type:complete